MLHYESQIAGIACNNVLAGKTSDTTGCDLLKKRIAGINHYRSSGEFL